MNKTSVIALSGDLLGAAASAALLARLFGICDDDLRRLRTTIHKSPRTAPDLLEATRSKPPMLKRWPAHCARCRNCLRPGGGFLA